MIFGEACRFVRCVVGCQNTRDHNNDSSTLCQSMNEDYDIFDGLCLIFSLKFSKTFIRDMFQRLQAACFLRFGKF